MSQPGRPNQTYFDLLEAFPQPGCVVCGLLVPIGDRLVQSVLYERWSDQPTHDAIRARRGLCATHSHQLTQYRGNAQTVAIFFRSAVDAAVRALESTPVAAPPERAGLATLLRRAGRSLSGAVRLAPEAPCLVCAEIGAAEGRYVETLARDLGEGRLAEAYRRSDGLCLPHTRMVLAAARDAGVREVVIDVQRRVWSELHDDLSTFIKKTGSHDYASITRRVSGSWQRAARLMPGLPALFGTDHCPSGGDPAEE